MSFWTNLKGTLEPIFKIGLSKGVFDASALTAERTLALPDISGTIALTSQLGGGGGASGVVTIDFGAFPGAQETSVAVTGQTGIAVTSLPRVAYKGDGSTATRNASDHKYIPEFTSLSVTTPTAGVGFTIHARSQYKLQGQYQVQWAY